MHHYSPCPINMAFHYLSLGLFVLCASPGSDRTLTSIIWGGHLHAMLLNGGFYCSACINALSWKQHIFRDWPEWPTALIYAGTTQPYSTVKPTLVRSLRSVLIVLFTDVRIQLRKKIEMHNKSGKEWYPDWGWSLTFELLITSCVTLLM